MQTQVFKRIMAKKKESGLTWDQITAEAHIKQGSWMTGLPTSSPSEDDLKKMAPVLGTTYEYLKNGKE